MTKLTNLWQILSNLVPSARRGERGSILILAALTSVLVIGSAGLAVDVSRMYAARAEVSRAVDAAALAGVLEFNGQASGLTVAQSTAQAYMTANEPNATSNIIADGATNKMTIKANKSVRLYFLSLFGFNSAPVYGHAVAGFQNQTIDAAMVVDSTGSMDGTPINNAKTAATNFVNTLLGSSPSGNVVVGVTPFRGCNRATTQSATAPFLTSDFSHTLCVNQNTEVTGLTSNTSTITTGLTNICPSDSCPGGSGTNVCTGLAKGWQVLEGSGNHTASANNRRYVVLLTDGDNYYNGDYTYQSSPYASPHTYQTWPCQPPSACTGFTGSPCHAGTWTGSPVTVASDGFDSGNFTGGTGWAAGWTSTNSPSVTSTTTQAGTYKAQLNQTDAITRSVNLSTVSDASMTYYLRANSTSWSSSDRAYVETSPDNTTWTTRATYCYGCFVSGVTSLSSSGYNQYSISLTSLVGDSSAYVRFRTNITSGSTHYLYADTVTITDPATSSDGYLDGTDGSGGTSCSTTVPRERQLDVETLNMSRAMKLDGVEIFVVAFGACNGSSTTVYNNSVAAQCNPTAQISPAAVPSPAGPVGNTDDDNTADNRLLKCVASSTVGTNDHYFYAASATDLPNIFTTIAAQIAHRLVE